MRYLLIKRKTVFATVNYLLEHLTGIEPAYSAWEANVLPLNYRCMLFIVTKKNILSIKKTARCPSYSFS